jgi:hypothetical protein
LRDLGRALLLVAAVLAVVGAALLWHDRIPGLGRLPGDLVFRRGGTTVYVPIATSILLSLILSLIAWVVFRR